MIALPVRADYKFSVQNFLLFFCGFRMWEALGGCVNLFWVSLGVAILGRYSYESQSN